MPAHLKHSRSWIVWLVAIVALSTGCSNPSGPDSELVSVTGTVTGISAILQVDGFVKMEIESLGDGKTEHLYLLRRTITEEEFRQIHAVTLQLEIGDVVEAQGERTEAGIELHSMTIL